MKTLLQISKETNISKSTLTKRLRRMEIVPIQEGKYFLINREQEHRLLVSNPVHVCRNRNREDYMIINSSMNYDPH